MPPETKPPPTFKLTAEEQEAHNALAALITTPVPKSEYSHVPHILATYRGTYYHPTSGGGGAQKAEQFEFKDLRVPMDLVTDPAHTPYSIFAQIFAPRVLMQKHGHQKTQYIKLVEAKGVPIIEDQDHILNWMTDYNDLVQVADKTKPEYIPYDPNQGELGNIGPARQRAEIRVSLYPNPDSLRHAIRSCRLDPEAFMKTQNAKANNTALSSQKRIDQTMAALGY
jgi:hypothetical protein